MPADWPPIDAPVRGAGPLHMWDAKLGAWIPYSQWFDRRIDEMIERAKRMPPPPEAVKPWDKPERKQRNARKTGATTASLE